MSAAAITFQRRVRDLGCVVCLVHRGIFTECEIHHCLSGGRRIGEMNVLGLCMPHHRGGRNDDECVSRDHNQRRFEAAYGTEAELLKKTKELIGERNV